MERQFTSPVQTQREELTPLFKKYGVVLAYLFGSQAQGRTTPLSDLDLAVLFDDSLPPQTRWDLHSRLGADLIDLFDRNDIDVVDLQEASPLLQYEVYRDGQLLLAADQATRVTFEVGVLQRYADTEKLRRIEAAYFRERRKEGERVVKLEVIQERLQTLEEYLRHLERLQTIPLDELRADVPKLWMVAHGLQVTIESVLDISEHLLVGLQLGRPKDRAEVIRLLGEAGVIPRPLAEKAKGMVGFRNILVHEYTRVDPERVYAVLQTGPVEIRELTGYLISFLKAQGCEVQDSWPMR